MPFKLYRFLLIGIIVINCCKPYSGKDDGTKLLDYGKFTMRVPQRWTPIIFNCIDCNAVGFQAGKDTIAAFNYGGFCDPLNEDREYKHFIIEEGKLYVPDTTVKNPEPRTQYWTYFGKADRLMLEKVRWNKVRWIFIDQYKAKLVTPKQVGKGITGVYIDSLWELDSSKEQFVLSGNNLSLVQQQQLLQVIQSLKFYKNRELHLHELE